MAKHKVEIQDHLGNIYYPHTTTDVVFDGSGKRLSSLLDNKLSRSVVSANIILLNSFVAFSSSHFCIVEKIADRIAHLCITAKKQDYSSFGGIAHIATIPTGFRPKRFIDFPVETTSITDVVTQGRATISPGGEIVITATGEGINSFGLSVVYFI